MRNSAWNLAIGVMTWLQPAARFQLTSNFKVTNNCVIVLQTCEMISKHMLGKVEDSGKKRSNIQTDATKPGGGGRELERVGNSQWELPVIFPLQVQGMLARLPGAARAARQYTGNRWGGTPVPVDSPDVHASYYSTSTTSLGPRVAAEIPVLTYLSRY